MIGEFSWRRVARSMLLIPVFVYLGLFMIAWLIPDSIIFRPQRSLYKDDTDVIKLDTADGKSISARFYENPGARYTILFSHGNAEDLGTIGPFVKNLCDGGFNVLAYDYHGFGTSEGSPTETNTYNDIDAAYQYLISVRKIEPDHIILHGRSLGGGAAVDLASRKPVGGLIMESTFTSITRVLTRIRIFPFDKFESLDKIGRVNCPVLIIHGKQDGTIPFHHGQSLFAAARDPKTAFWVDDAGHNNLFYISGQAYIAAIREFAESLNQ